MEQITLTEDEEKALTALLEAARKYPEADFFEHVRSGVVMSGARHDVQIPVSREMLRRLGHLKGLEFTGERDGFGRGRWTFVLTARAADLV